MAETQDSRGRSRVRGILAQSKAEATLKNYFFRKRSEERFQRKKIDGS
jgi:hypothetical protein